ncbi:MAG TPA: hypothetical protein VLB44_16515 [Kofleriaceae bacterium]|nr:hypothetical protein [Kofleriaceae bacterium]
MAEAQVLVVTSAGAPPSAVVPVLAAIEAAGMRVRAIDVGSVGTGGSGVADRMRRALMGEGAERKLRRELEMSPPDAAVVFDPHSALALTVARDQVQNPAPVIAVVGDLEPAAAWAQTDADRFLAVDELAAVALADAGVEGDRILVVGAIGERAYAEAGLQDRTSLKARFKLSGRVALVDVGGLGAEVTGQLSMQLSLLDTSSVITFLFDAGNDAEAAAVLRRQVPALGLRGKLFGATSADGPLLWRAADVIVGRPRLEVVSRVLLVGGKLVALIDDNVPNAAQTAASLEARKRAVAAKGLLLLSSALDSAFGGALPAASDDGADQIADIVAVVAGDKRSVIDERRSAAQAATRERVARATSAAQAAAAQTAMPGDLEDLGGGGGGFAEAVADLPDRAELERLRGEVAQRVAELTKSMAAARDAATELADKAKGAAARGATDEATQLERKADGERARMHALLAELATLEAELKDLERSIKSLGDLPKSSATSTSSSSSRAEAPPRPSAPPRTTIDDELERLKRQGGGGSPPKSSAPRPSAGKPSSSSSSKAPGTVDDELAALKKKMSQQPPKKK